MGGHGNTLITEKTIREVWVRRDDGGLECKPWLIFEIKLPDTAQDKIRAFLASEDNRTYHFGASPPSQAEMQSSAEYYTRLYDAPAATPPRLLAINERDLENTPTELTKKGWYILGDSVGGISKRKPKEHNAYLSDKISDENVEILFSPGLLCRIPIDYEEGRKYVFQLAEKNLRVKGQAFYKPIGGHLKYTDKFRRYINEFGLKTKGSLMPQDVGDVAFFVDKIYFNELRKIFLNEILVGNSEFLLRPEHILFRELQEELGPIGASDGISLLSAEELEINDSENY